MKKSLSQAIALATLLGGAAAAQAVEVNHEGIGGALLYPLYSVQGDNTTVLSVTNTSNDYKAVKVRFVEGQNSAEVLDFHLYMSPQDVWAGSLVPTATGARLITNDTSCIAGVTNKDGVQSQELNFSHAQIKRDEASKDIPSTSQELANRVKVGHFEVIEMATVADQDLQKAIKHVNGVPGNCAEITHWWTEDLRMGEGHDRENRGVEALDNPTGGLYGNATIINVKAGWAASYDAVALVNDLTPVPVVGGEEGETEVKTNFYTDIQHPRPGSIYPHLATVRDQVGGEDNIVGVKDNTTPNDAQLDAVTEALRLSSIYNDYYVDAALNATTDLVVTFPTKRFYTFNAADLDNVNNGYKYTGANNPFDTNWDGEKAPVAFDATIYDREEEKLTVKAEDGFVSPRPIEEDASIALNWEANVISLSEDSDSFGAEAAGVRTEVLTKNDVLDFKSGWIQITRVGGKDDNKDTVPAIGFANIVTKNGVSADGALRNFAQTFKNKTVSK